ncbi:hypothetical protein KQI52_00040 [bacterium]|nr:hypothetical protein [bacterium]
MDQVNGSILLKPWLVQLALPLITIVLSVFLRVVTRNDIHKTLRAEDFAVGFEVIIASVIIYIVGSVNMATKCILSTNENDKMVLAGKIVNMPWLLLAYFFFLWGLSTIVRKFGWKDEDELKPFIGIILPDFLGIGLLIFTVNWVY